MSAAWGISPEEETPPQNRIAQLRWNIKYNYVLFLSLFALIYKSFLQILLCFFFFRKDRSFCACLSCKECFPTHITLEKIKLFALVWGFVRKFLKLFVCSKRAWWCGSSVLYLEHQLAVLSRFVTCGKCALLWLFMITCKLTARTEYLELSFPSEDAASATRPPGSKSKRTGFTQVTAHRTSLECECTLGHQRPAHPCRTGVSAPSPSLTPFSVECLREP